MDRRAQIAVSAALALGVLTAYVWWRRHANDSAEAAIDSEPARAVVEGGVVMSFKLSSTGFRHEGDIPAKHTCEGGDVAPALAWSMAPPNTKSFALIVDDPDAPDPKAPRTTWVHWVLYDLPPTAASLPEGAARASLPPGTHEGKNDWKQPGYRGPCPPIGKHRYYFKLYALDVVLPELNQPSKAALERAMEGHVIGQATLMGYYQKAGK